MGEMGQDWLVTHTHQAETDGTLTSDEEEVPAADGSHRDRVRRPLPESFTEGDRAEPPTTSYASCTGREALPRSLLAQRCLYKSWEADYPAAQPLEFTPAGALPKW